MTGLPARARVVIVGGGFAGAATAYHLGRLGVGDVALLEREPTFGVHASGRNAALGRQLTEDERVSDLTVRGAAFLREPPADFCDGPLLSRSGSVLLVDGEAELAALEARARRRRLPCERVSMALLRERWPALEGVQAAGGLASPSDGVIDVHALLHGYLGGARAAGAALVSRCEVVGVARRGGGAVVETSAGACEAEIVVNAAGAWAGPVGALAGGRAQPLTPIHRHLFVTEPVAGLDAGAPFVWHIGAREFYLRPEGRGLLLSACDETPSAPCDARVAPGAIEMLAARMSDAAPAVAELGIARAWACLRTFAPDRRPVIGWDAALPHLFWVAALGGHGATASAAIGADAAAAIAQRLRA